MKHNVLKGATQIKFIILLLLLLGIQTLEDPVPELGRSSSLTRTSITRDCAYIWHYFLNNKKTSSKIKIMPLTHVRVCHRAEQACSSLYYCFGPSSEGVLSEWTNRVVE